MRINFILPFPYKSGGIIVVLEYSRLLRKKGHSVNVYYPLIPYLTQVPRKNKIRKMISWCLLLLRNLKAWKRSMELYGEFIGITPVAIINNLYIRDADVSIATAWSTACSLNKLSKDKGKKCYLIQGYEIWDEHKNHVEETYRLPFKILTVSPWLTGIMENKYNRQIAGELVNGIRLDRFYPAEKKGEKPLIILMQFHELECKGALEGIKACSMIKREFSEVKIIFFGLFKRPEVDFQIEYYFDPSYDQLLKLYQSAHIFLFPSHNEGWGMPPIEAMACKCAVVGTNIGSIQYFNNGNNVQLIEARSVLSAYEGLKTLLLNKEKRERIAEEGYNSIQENSWENSAKKLENVFEKIIEENSP